MPTCVFSLNCGEPTVGASAMDRQPNGIYPANTPDTKEWS